MPKTLIVPLDGSPFAERALVPAFTFARQARVTPVLVMSRLGGVTDPESYLVSAAGAAGIEHVRTEVFDDRLAPSAILTLAETEPDPVVCMSTHARSTPGEALLGSVTADVMRRGHVPLLLVGPSYGDVSGQPFEELIVCLDGSAIADSIVPVAMVLARDLDIAICLITVVEPDPAIPVDFGLDGDVSETARLQRLARDLSDTGVAVTWEVLHGEDPAAEIVRFAGTRAAPLVAMTTHGRSGFSRLVAGSVAMAVLHSADCPVLVIRHRDALEHF